MRFKVGDKVRIRKDLVAGKVYDGYTFTMSMEKYKGRILTIDTVDYNSYYLKEVGYCWTDKMLEEVNEYEIEKTFREVIRDIKEGEVWEGERFDIVKKENSTIIKHTCEFDRYYSIDDEEMFKLQRKQYTFQEVFKAYEEDKEIESICSGYKYKKENGEDKFFSTSSDKWVKAYDNTLFNMIEIRGMWYINN